MIKVNFNAPDHARIYQGDADMVIAPSVNGDIGLLSGHEPVMILLQAGVVKISSHDDKGNTQVTKAQITGGFLDFRDDELNIEADNVTVL
jgi:F-type H+-transporting ATPase subunit epsilon